MYINISIIIIIILHNVMIHNYMTVLYTACRYIVGHIQLSHLAGKGVDNYNSTKFKGRIVLYGVYSSEGVGHKLLVMADF